MSQFFSRLPVVFSGLIAGLLLTLSGCASLQQGVTFTRDLSTEAKPVVSAQLSTRFQQAMQQLNSGHLAEAEVLLEQLLAEYPKQPQVVLNLGLLGLKRGKNEQAVAHLETATTFSATRSAAFNQLGVFYRQQGEFKKAEQRYRLAFKDDASYAVAHKNLAILYELYLGKFPQALDHYQQYQQLQKTADPQVARWIKGLQRRLKKGKRDV